MTLNEKKRTEYFNNMFYTENESSVFLGFDEENQREIHIVLDDDRHLLLAELIADESTIRNRKEFIRDWPGHTEYDFKHGLAADYNRVRDFADTYNLKYGVIDL